MCFGQESVITVQLADWLESSVWLTNNNHECKCYLLLQNSNYSPNDLSNFKFCLKLSIARMHAKDDNTFTCTIAEYEFVEFVEY